MKEHINSFGIEGVMEHWDNVADIYDGANKAVLNPHEWRFIEGIKHLEASRSSNIKLLNCWSRTGDAISFIRTKLPNAKIHNFEVSKNMIEIAKKKYPNDDFHVTDLRTINLPDDSMDYIMSPETLEHTPMPQELINEFYRVLKPGGRLILSHPPRIADFHQWVWENIVNRGNCHGEGPRKGIWSKMTKTMLNNTGFVLLKHKSILMIPVGGKTLIGFGDWLTKTFPFLRELGVMQFYLCTKPKHSSMEEKKNS